jgi:hypothetical protein
VTFNELVDEVRSAAGIDVANAATRVGRWVNLGIRELATRSGWNKAELELGPTVADQADYALPSTVYRVIELKVGSLVYTREGTETGWRLTSGDVGQVGHGGFFYEKFDSGGTKTLALYPVPQDAGSTITALVIAYPQTYSGDTEVAVIPEEHQIGVVHRAVAWGLSFGDEHDEAADWHIGKFEEEVEKLRRHSNARLSSTVQTAKIAGIHF